MSYVVVLIFSGPESNSEGYSAIIITSYIEFLESGLVKQVGVLIHDKARRGTALRVIHILMMCCNVLWLLAATNL